MDVKAKRKGFLGGRIREAGDVFQCEENQFSETWMVEVKPAAKKPAAKKQG